MTNHTEMEQREKFEAWAEEVGAQPWGYLKKQRNPSGGYSVQIYTYMWAAWKAAGAELVEALEKAQRANEHLREQSAEWERKAISNFEDCAEMSARVEELGSQRKLAFTASNRWADKFREAEKRIAELESRTVKMPKPHAHLIWIQAGHAPDDFWDDVAVSHSEKDRCCDGSERYPVYARWEIEEMLAAAGIKWEAE